MDLTLLNQNDRLGITVEANRIDAQAALKFKDAVHTACNGAHSWVILDLSKVDFVEPSGLGAIVSIKKHLGKDRRIDLASLEPAVEKVFRLTRMDSVFRIYPSLAHAMADDITA